MMNFWNSSKGVGAFSIEKFIIQILNLLQGFLNIKFEEEKMQYDCPKMRARGSKAVENFSENSSVLVARKKIQETLFQSVSV